MWPMHAPAPEFHKMWPSHVFSWDMHPECEWVYVSYGISSCAVAFLPNGPRWLHVGTFLVWCEMMAAQPLTQTFFVMG